MDSITDERYYEYMIRRSREEDAIMAQENVINKAATYFLQFLNQKLLVQWL